MKTTQQNCCNPPKIDSYELDSIVRNGIPNEYRRYFFGPIPILKMYGPVIITFAQSHPNSTRPFFSWYRLLLVLIRSVILYMVLSHRIPRRQYVYGSMLS